MFNIHKHLLAQATSTRESREIFIDVPKPKESPAPAPNVPPTPEQQHIERLRQLNEAIGHAMKLQENVTAFAKEMNDPKMKAAWEAAQKEFDEMAKSLAAQVVEVSGSLRNLHKNPPHGKTWKEDGPLAYSQSEMEVRSEKGQSIPTATPGQAIPTVEQQERQREIDRLEKRIRELDDQIAANYNRANLTFETQKKGMPKQQWPNLRRLIQRQLDQLNIPLRVEREKLLRDLQRLGGDPSKFAGTDRPNRRQRTIPDGYDPVKEKNKKQALRETVMEQFYVDPTAKPLPFAPGGTALYPGGMNEYTVSTPQPKNKQNPQKVILDAKGNMIVKGSGNSSFSAPYRPGEDNPKQMQMLDKDGNVVADTTNNGRWKYVDPNARYEKLKPMTVQEMQQLRPDQLKKMNIGRPLEEKEPQLVRAFQEILSDYNRAQQGIDFSRVPELSRAFTTVQQEYNRLRSRWAEVITSGDPVGYIQPLSLAAKGLVSFVNTYTKRQQQENKTAEEQKRFDAMKSNLRGTTRGILDYLSGVGERATGEKLRPLQSAYDTPEKGVATSKNGRYVSPITGRSSPSLSDAFRNAMLSEQGARAGMTAEQVDAYQKANRRKSRTMEEAMIDATTQKGAPKPAQKNSTKPAETKTDAEKKMKRDEVLKLWNEAEEHLKLADTDPANAALHLSKSMSNYNQVMLSSNLLNPQDQLPIKNRQRVVHEKLKAWRAKQEVEKVKEKGAQQEVKNDAEEKYKDLVKKYEKAHGEDDYEKRKNALSTVLSECEKFETSAQFTQPQRTRFVSLKQQIKNSIRAAELLMKSPQKAETLKRNAESTNAPETSEIQMQIKLLQPALEDLKKVRDTKPKGSDEYKRIEAQCVILEAQITKLKNLLNNGKK